MSPPALPPEGMVSSPAGSRLGPGPGDDSPLDSPTVQSVADVAAIAPLFDKGDPGADAFSTHAWFANLAATGVDPGDVVRFDIVAGRNGCACVFPLRSGADRFGPLRGRLLSGLSSLYSCRFAPVGLDQLDEETACAVVATWLLSLRQGQARPSRIAFDGLAEGSTALAALDTGLRRAGYWVERYAHFGNWYLPTRGLSLDSYWSSRPTALRNTIRRKEKAVRRRGAVDITIHSDPSGSDQAIQDYQHVHAASWKPAEPYPEFMPGLIRTGLAAGLVRVGVLSLDGEPAAAQIWLTAHRKATIFKLSYHEAHRDLSVGSLLTRSMMAEALDGDTLDEIDFGRGDDPYKRDWLPERRQRWGLVGYSTASPCAIAQAVRNLAPRAARRLAQRAMP